jgi:TnpA family transposase
VDRDAYVVCVLEQLFRALNRRDVFASPSNRWADPRARLLDGKRWEAVAEDVLHGLSLDEPVEEHLAGRVRALDAAWQLMAERLEEAGQDAKLSFEVKPTTVHADTQGQSFPVFAIGHLLGFDLMPRIRNWKGLTFYRPSKQSEYVHIDALFGEAGKNVIDWDLIESQFRHLMRVAVSVREGVISSATLLKRLRSGSHKNATYTAFREVGRVIRTVQLLRYLSDAPLRRRVTAATNKVESFNRFSQWVGFGNQGVIADNDPIEQEKAMKFNALLTNAVIFHNALDIAEIVRHLLAEGWEIDPEDLAHISPYLTEHIKRFGEYSTHELGIQPEAYDPKLNVDFTQLREQEPAASGFDTAA